LLGARRGGFRAPGKPDQVALGVFEMAAGTHRTPPTETYRVQLDDRVWTVSSQDGQPEIKAGDTAAPVGCLRTDPETLNALLLNPGGLDSAIATGAVHAEGDLVALRRLLNVAA
jgi:SCP-2 sterol transfer family